MALTLVATPGAANANTYVTRADADAYFEAHRFATSWTSASTTAKDQALAHATMILDRERWTGTKGIASAGALTQALAWPRRWAPTLEIDADPNVVSEYFADEAVGYYDETTIPQPIVRATCELALALLKAGTTDPFDQDVSRVKSETVDVLSTEYFDSQDTVRNLGRFPHVLRLVAPLLRSVGGTEVVRG